MNPTDSETSVGWIPVFFCLFNKLLWYFCCVAMCGVAGDWDVWLLRTLNFLPVPVALTCTSIFPHLREGLFTQSCWLRKCPGLARVS